MGMARIWQGGDVVGWNGVGLWKRRDVGFGGEGRRRRGASYDTSNSPSFRLGCSTLARARPRRVSLATRPSSRPRHSRGTLKEANQSDVGIRRDSLSAVLLEYLPFLRRANHSLGRLVAGRGRGARDRIGSAVSARSAGTRAARSRHGRCSEAREESQEKGSRTEYNVTKGEPDKKDGKTRMWVDGEVG